MSEEEKILKTIRYCANDYMKQEDGIQCFEWGDLWVLNEYIEKIKQENQQLKEKINTYENPEDLTLMFMYCDEKAKDKIKDLNEKVDYLKNKCENKDKWCQLIADIGYDYDGYRQADSLMKLIDELVKYAILSRDNYDYDAFQEEGNNE